MNYTKHDVTIMQDEINDILEWFVKQEYQLYCKLSLKQEIFLILRFEFNETKVEEKFLA